MCEPQEAATDNTNDGDSKKAIGTGCYIIVDYLNRKAKQTFVGQVIAQHDDDIEVNFMRKADESSRAIVFPEKVDIDYCVKRSQIVMVLAEPEMDNKFRYWFQKSILVYK